MLSCIFQPDYETIEEYWNEIEQINIGIRFILRLEEGGIKRRTTETFYTNLHYLTKLEMQRHGILHMNKSVRASKMLKQFNTSNLQRLSQKEINSQTNSASLT